ncbi:MAG TPA: Hpt domain-containing protein, partial [Kofleriaceae bacterium]|nr:Hpt domain-containing protein [Kofleriaceae bacterium]
MSDELDFDADELAMLCQLFRSEAQDGLELVTARLLATGLVKPSEEALTEMMRVTHTLKGSAGTVGLPVMVDLAHRLENVFAAFRRGAVEWTPTTADLVVEVIDALRSYLDRMNEPNADVMAEELRVTIDQLAQPPRRVSSPSLATAPAAPP